MTFSFRMPLRFLRGNYGRLTLAAGALALGVAQVTADDLAGRGTARAFVKIVDVVAGRAALQVSAGEGAPFGDDVVAKIATVPGVELAVPVVSSTVFTSDNTGELLTVHGIDLTSKKAIAVYELHEVSGAGLDDPKVLQTDAIVLTRDFAARRGLHLGSSIELDTTRGRQRFAVRALLAPEGLARIYGGNLALVDLQNAQELFVRPGQLNRVDVVVALDRQVAQVAAAIRRILPAGLSVEAPSQRKADLQQVMRAFQLLLNGLSIIGVVAAFLIAFSSLSTIFEGRAWQLGVLRAIGVRRGALRGELLKEGVILGVMGTAVGLPLGIGIGKVLLPAIATAAALNSKLIAPKATLVVEWPSLVLATVLGMGVAVLAAALPARRMARVGMAVTMRNRGVEQAGLGLRGRVFVALLVLTAAVVVTVVHVRLGWPVLGVVATGLLTVAVAQASRPTIQLSAPGLLRVARWVGGPSAELGIKNLTQNPRRATLTVAMIGVGLGSVLWLWIVGHSFERSVIDAVSGAMRADLVVSSAHSEAGFLESPVSDELVGRLAKIPGVATVAAERVADWPYHRDLIAISACDPAYFVDPGFGQWPLLSRGSADLWQAVARGDAAAVSSSFVVNVGAGLGDTLRLDTPRGPLALPVAGVVTHFASPRGTIEMSRDAYKRYWNDTKVTRVYVRVAPGWDRSIVRAEIAARLGRVYNLRILSAAEIVDYFADQVRKAFAGVYILAALMLSVVLMGMSDTLVAGVVERTREIGSIRVVGVRRRYVRQMVFAEALVLGALGLCLAGAVGLTLGNLWVDATLPALLGWVFNPYLPYGRACVTAVATLLVCLLAAWSPARRAAQLEPAVAVRYE